MRPAAKEVCFLLDAAGRVLWSDEGDGPLSLPDSRARWEAIWSRRELLAEVAHSHPRGPLAFSGEDRTTMAALTAALGRALRFSVVAPGGTLLRDEAGAERVLATEPPWADELRRRSGMIGD